MASQAWPSWPAPQLVAAVAKAFISCPASRLQFINFERNYFITTAPVPGAAAGDGDGEEPESKLELACCILLERLGFLWHDLGS